jgi:hypothetical protein
MKPALPRCLCLDNVLCTCRTHNNMCFCIFLIYSYPSSLFYPWCCGVRMLTFTCTRLPRTSSYYLFWPSFYSLIPMLFAMLPLFLIIALLLFSSSFQICLSSPFSCPGSLLSLSLPCLPLLVRHIIPPPSRVHPRRRIRRQAHPRRTKTVSTRIRGVALLIHKCLSPYH